jgi:hypothetical protein
MMGEWDPVLDRGDGVWLGVVDGSVLGIGSWDAISKKLQGGNYIPLWPLLEKEFDETLAMLSATWNDFSRCGLDTPESFMQLVVDSAIKGGRPYWTELSTHWLARMAVHDGFDYAFVKASLEQVLDTAQVAQSVRHEARRAIKSMVR